MHYPRMPQKNENNLLEIMFWCGIGGGNDYILSWEYLCLAENIGTQLSWLDGSIALRCNPHVDKQFRKLR